jgi:hypothetical protein
MANLQATLMTSAPAQFQVNRPAMAWDASLGCGEFESLAEGEPSPHLHSTPTQFSWAPDADGSFSDTSSANSNGADSFTFDSTGGTTDSNIATGSLPVAPVEDPPTSSSDGTAVGTENAVIPGQLPNALNVQSPTTAAASSVVPASTHTSVAGCADHCRVCTRL